MSANDRQVGGDHYKKTAGEQHWDRQWRLHGPGYFVGCITKYTERYRDKNGVEDLRKARHFIDKLIELEEQAEAAKPKRCPCYYGSIECVLEEGHDGEHQGDARVKFSELGALDDAPDRKKEPFRGVVYPFTGPYPQGAVARAARVNAIEDQL